jgi:hypothetical protein
MTRYFIKTSGKGMLEAGRTVGFIDAESPERAEDALIKSGQVPERARGLFRFETETSDPFWDDSFHAIAIQAFVAQAVEEQGWPDPEKTKQRAYKLFEDEKRKAHDPVPTS